MHTCTFLLCLQLGLVRTSQGTTSGEILSAEKNKNAHSKSQASWEDEPKLSQSCSYQMPCNLRYVKTPALGGKGAWGPHCAPLQQAVLPGEPKSLEVTYIFHAHGSISSVRKVFFPCYASIDGAGSRKQEDSKLDSVVLGLKRQHRHHRNKQQQQQTSERIKSENKERVCHSRPGVAYSHPAAPSARGVFLQAAVFPLPSKTPPCTAVMICAGGPGATGKGLHGYNDRNNNKCNPKHTRSRCGPTASEPTPPPRQLSLQGASFCLLSPKPTHKSSYKAGTASFCVPQV